MFKLELHAAQGGKDSELFAEELARALSALSNQAVTREGRVLAIFCL
jgi:protein subunit release factor A